MKILTKQYGFTENDSPKFLIYIKEHDNNIECFDIIGNKNRMLKEYDLYSKYDIENIEYVDYETYRIDNGILTKSYPLILIVYMDKDLMSEKEIFSEVFKSFDMAIKQKEANIMTFFIPCDSEKERIECINPIIVDQGQKDRIDNLINELEDKFIKV